MSASVAGAAGVVAGVVGVGGGTMIGPILLEFGVHPQVSSCSCSFAVCTIHQVCRSMPTAV